MNPYAAIALSNLIGGSTYSATAVALRGFTPRDLVFWRMLICALIFLPFAWRARRRIAALDRTAWLQTAAVGLLGYALPLALGIYGTNLSSATSASLLVGMEPVTIVLLSALFLGERMSGLKGLSLVMGIAGSLLIAFQGPPRLDGAFSDRLKGDLILAAHGCCWALYSVIGKAALARMRPMDFTVVSTLFGAAGALAWALPGTAPAAWNAAPLSAWASMAYVAICGGCVAVVLWNSALAHVEASRVANFIFLQPLFGVVLGVLIQGDPFTGWSAAGGALVLGGMWAATR